MKIVFFGLGSIGQRHARILLKDYSHDIFALRSSLNNKKNNLGVKELHSWTEIEKLKPDIAFITNPTYLHIETAIKCAKIGCKLFIEKPVDKDINNLDKLLKIVKAKNLVTYVAYNLRFHPIIKTLIEYLQKQKPVYVRVVCSSYLPNWRTDRDYLKSYSANSNMGGGVILDLSHELDYICYLFGETNEIKGNFSKQSNITVDAEDCADLLFLSGGIPVNIHIDFLSQFNQRYIQIDFNKLTVIGDLINKEIREYENGSLKNTQKLDYDNGQEYIEQMKYFFDNINNPEMMNNLAEASRLFGRIIKFKKNE